jgi:hypothetical protein
MGTEKVLLAGGAVHQPQTADELRFPPIGTPRPSSEVRMAGNETVYLPAQNVRRGVAGYKIKNSNTIVLDADGRPVPQKKKK